ncbi:glutathione S-transferase family protein [Litorilituus lipolyticus]|uniref:glutathione transferase n=1 Tax=Litorilituus lipolyticus TaxID=2491017 RepID=A0A502L2J8_9GAMM|nr:glutathione S-transferase family protein [Litorilituus lipolyticus]TPH18132.1 glutathione S-transferase family protein [Litorilituus lipolyticus]
MIKLISFKNCPFVQRVMAALAVKDIPFEIEYIELSNKPQWFFDISPNGQVPVLITENDTILFESDAIVEYLDDKYAPIESLSPEQKALDRAWSYQASKHYMVQCGTMSSKDKETFESRFESLAKAFAKAEKKLTGKRFFKGESISNVDIAWLPLLHRALIIKQGSGFDMLAEYPKVQQWQSELYNSGLMNKAVPDDFIEVFSHFYLTNNYLASLKNNNQQGCMPKSQCDTRATSLSCCG